MMRRTLTRLVVLTSRGLDHNLKMLPLLHSPLFCWFGGAVSSVLLSVLESAIVLSSFTSPRSRGKLKRSSVFTLGGSGPIVRTQVMKKERENIVERAKFWGRVPDRNV